MSLYLEVRGVADFNDGNPPRMWRRNTLCWPCDGEIREWFDDLPGSPSSIRIFDPSLRFWSVRPIGPTVKFEKGDRLQVVVPLRWHVSHEVEFQDYTAPADA